MSETGPNLLLDETDYLHEAPKKQENYHGGPDVWEALHLGEGESLKGKRVFFIGNLVGRWSFDEQLKKQGASVVTRGIDSIANPRTRLHKGSSEFKGRQYDQILFYMCLAFYKKSALKKILNASFDAVDFDNGGEFSAVSFDFSSFEQHAASAQAGPEERALQEIMFRFFKASGLDPYQGASLGDVVRKTAQGRGLEVTETTNARSAGPQYWEEIRDLCLMLREQARTAAEGMKETDPVIQALFLKKTIEEFEHTANNLTKYLEIVESILKLPESQRPIGMPPIIKTISVRKASS
jgi:hypothetical protein